MLFWRTHFAWSVEYDEWNPGDERWSWRFTHYSDYETALAEWDRVTELPPGRVRNIRLRRRPVGMPMNWLRSA